MSHEHEHERRLEKIEQELHCVHEDVKRILRIFALKKIDFVQLGGPDMNFSVQAGQIARFQSILTPVNGTQAPGTHPVWTASDPSVVLSPAPDGSFVDATVPLGSTLTTFNLSISATSSDPTVGAAGVVTAAHDIAVTQPPPPPPALQSIDFSQISG